MNVKIDYNVDVSDKVRLAIARLDGKRGLATRGDVKVFFKRHGIDEGYEKIADEIFVINRETEAMTAKLLAGLP